MIICVNEMICKILLYYLIYYSSFSAGAYSFIKQLV